ncbi:MAG: replication protein, partial [Eubacteriales bacterium]|nr:replication protein [Eubacteriales bacterium]
LLDSGAYYMSNIELLIGQSSTEAERKRAARLQNKAICAPRKDGGHLSDIRPPEIEIELEKEIEIKREIEKGQTARAHGRYQNVFLSDRELADLQADFPTIWSQYIERLSEYMASTGKRYQSHAATSRRWASEDVKKAAPPSRNRDYSVKEDETV